MTKLTDTQTILLSTASQRAGGSLYPLPTTLTAPKPAITKSITALLSRDLIEERETSDPSAVHRTDGDLRFGLYIIAAGEAAIGVTAVDPNVQGAHGLVLAESAPKLTKSATVLTLLQRPEGATVTELISATGWLPHTTRAALTGFRKKGHVIDKGKRGEATCYRIAVQA